jgi:lipopolysaccharide transport system permease protein
MMSSPETVGREEPTPTTVIRPQSGWVGLDLGELWAYRELLYYFVWRDLKVRYRQTAFGAAWALLQPLLMVAIFTLVLGNVGGLAPAGVPYPVFALAGLVPWTLFSQSLLGASGSLVNAGSVLQKVYFPRLLVPVASVGSFILDFLIGLAALGVVMLVSGMLPTGTVFLTIPMAVLAIGVALSVGIWLSAVNVRYRDVRHVMPFLAQAWLFASPVAYPVDVIPEQLRAIYTLNPMVGVLEGFRWCLFGGTPAPLPAILVSVIVTAVLLVTGIAYFRRTERTFADVI